MWSGCSHIEERLWAGEDTSRVRVLVFAPSNSPGSMGWLARKGRPFFVMMKR